MDTEPLTPAEDEAWEEHAAALRPYLDWSELERGPTGDAVGGGE